MDTVVKWGLSEEAWSGFAPLVQRTAEELEAPRIADLGGVRILS